MSIDESRFLTPIHSGSACHFHCLSSSRIGLGFKHQYYPDIVAQKPILDFFEIHAENYMGAGGLTHDQLAEIRNHYDLSLHGVGLSLGGMEPLSKCHLQKLKKIIDTYQPIVFSEHLAWSSFDQQFFNDLLPLPYNQETLRVVIDNVKCVQDFIGHKILIENPATYVRFKSSDMSEIEFLNELVQHTDCGLLLDITNAYICSINHNFDPLDYVSNFPLNYVDEVHLAGFTEDKDELGASLLIDAHSREVPHDVWALFDHVIAQKHDFITLIEWDNNMPEWPILYRQAVIARERIEQNRIYDIKN
jgi:uncharacterized protein (UPF0276 family)